MQPDANSTQIREAAEVLPRAPAVLLRRYSKAFAGSADTGRRVEYRLLNSIFRPLVSFGENNLFAKEVAQGSSSAKLSNAKSDAVRHKLAKASSVLIYTDGACSGNPGPGGWGAAICDLSAGGGESTADLQHSLQLSGGEPETTNNRMELLAAIEALAVLPASCTAVLYTDSTYVQKGISQWIHAWKQKNWRTAAGKPVQNRDLWMQLDALAQPLEVRWCWVEGHAGHPGNELADALARSGIKRDY